MKHRVTQPYLEYSSFKESMRDTAPQRLEAKYWALPGETKETRAERIRRREWKVRIPRKKKKKEKTRANSLSGIAALREWNRSTASKILVEIIDEMGGQPYEQLIQETLGFSVVDIAMRVFHDYVKHMNLSIRRKPKSWVRMKQELRKNINRAIDSEIKWDRPDTVLLWTKEAFRGR